MQRRTTTTTAAALFIAAAALTLAPRAASACSGYNVNLSFGPDPSGQAKACAVFVFVPESGAIPYFEPDSIEVRAGTRTIGYSRSEQATSATIEENCKSHTINYTAHVLSLFEAPAAGTTLELVGRSGKNEVTIGKLTYAANLDCTVKPKPKPWACYPCNSNPPGPTPSPGPSPSPNPGPDTSSPDNSDATERGCACDTGTSAGSGGGALALVSLLGLALALSRRRR